MIDSFYNYLTIEKSYSKLTVCSYKNDISQFLLYLGLVDDTRNTEMLQQAEQQFSPSQYRARDLRYWIMEMSQQGLSSATINRRISAIKSLYSYYYRKGYIPTNSMQGVSSVRKERNVPVFVPTSVIQSNVMQLLEYSDDYQKEREELIILLLYATGIRLAELINIDLEDISLEQMQLVVTGKGDRQRIVPIISTLEKKLKNFLFLRSEICEIENKSLFLSNRNYTISRTEVYRIVRRVLSQWGLKGKRSPHVLRHTFATHLLGGGAGVESIKELLGHSSLSSTQIYTHSNIEQLKEAFNRAHPRANYKLKK